MNTSAEEAALFRQECLEWQIALGLTDWTLQFRAVKAPEQNAVEAETEFDVDTRHALVTYYLNVENSLHPRDVALHEMLHLALADLIAISMYGDELLIEREEHRLIERLLKVMRKSR